MSFKRIPSVLASFLLFAWSAAAFAGFDFSKCPFDSLVEATKGRVKEKVATTFPGVTSVTVKFASSSKHTEKFVVRVNFEQKPREIAATGGYDLVGERLTLSVDVKDKFREKEINRLVVQSILAKHPEIHDFPIDTHDMNTISVALGYLHPELPDAEFRQRVAKIAENQWDSIELFEAFEKENRKGLNEQKLIEAFRSRSPAGRLRQELGFDKIQFGGVDTDGAEPSFHFKAHR